MCFETRIFGVIEKFSRGKPIIVFCGTRRSTEITAKALADWWSQKGPRQQYWQGPRKPPSLRNPELKCKQKL
jgi:ATP-dependent DNA helicase HFM1/MER3